MGRSRAKSDGVGRKPYRPGLQEQQDLLCMLERASQTPGEVGETPEWRVLRLYFAQGRSEFPGVDDSFVDIMGVAYACGLLTAQSPRLAAAAAACLAHFFGPQVPDGAEHFAALVHYIPEIGGVIGSLAVVAAMEAAGEGDSVGRLTAAAAAAARHYENIAGRYKDVAQKLLPAVLRAVDWASRAACTALEDGIYIAAAAELFAQAAMLQLPADSPAAAHMDDPQLLPKALELAENAYLWMNQVLKPELLPGRPNMLPEQDKGDLALVLAKAYNWVLYGVESLLKRGQKLTPDDADMLLDILKAAFQQVSVATNPGASSAQQAALRLVCVTLWLSSGLLLRAALDAGSTDNIFFLAEAAAQVLKDYPCDTNLDAIDGRVTGLIAARYLRFTVGRHRHLSGAQEAMDTLEYQALPLLEPDRRPRGHQRSALALPLDWAATSPSHMLGADEDVRVLLADELAAAGAASARHLLAHPPAPPPGCEDLTQLAAVNAVVMLFGGTLLLATYLNGGGRGAADRPRRATLQRKFRLPGEPQAPDAGFATERDVAAALVEVAHAYAAVADLPYEQYERWCAASRPGEEWEHLMSDVLVGATAAAAALLAHLERELAACQRHGGGYVDSFWPLLRGVLGMVLFGNGNACPAMLEDFVDTEKGARILPRVMLAAAAASRTDVLQGLCSILEKLVQRAPDAARFLLPPLANPPTWPEYVRQFQQKAKRQQHPDAEAAVAAVTAALEAALKAHPPSPADIQQAKARDGQAAGSSGGGGRNQQGIRLSAQRASAASLGAADTAADQGARMLLQEEDERMQQQEAQAAKAARKKAKKQRQKEKKAAASTAEQLHMETGGGAVAPAAAPPPHTQPEQLSPPAAPAGQGDAAGEAAGSQQQQQQGAEAMGAAAVEGDHDSWRLCPLTQAVMVDPVLLPEDGRTYERSAIVEWIDQHGTSPLTRLPVNVTTLTPNHALRSLLQAIAS